MQFNCIISRCLLVQFCQMRWIVFEISVQQVSRQTKFAFHIYIRYSTSTAFLYEFPKFSNISIFVFIYRLQPKASFKSDVFCGLKGKLGVTQGSFGEVYFAFDLSWSWSLMSSDVNNFRLPGAKKQTSPP